MQVEPIKVLLIQCSERIDTNKKEPPRRVSIVWLLLVAATGEEEMVFFRVTSGMGRENISQHTYTAAPHTDEMLVAAFKPAIIVS